MKVRGSSLRILFFMAFLSAGMPYRTMARLLDTPFVRISVDRDQILLGEPFTLTISCTGLASGDAVEMPSTMDPIGHFEVIGQLGTDSLALNGSYEKRVRLRLTSFDSGHWVIPPIAVAFAGKRIYSDTLPIDVGMTTLQGTEYNDIRDIMEIPEESWNWKPWLIASVIALLLALLAFRYLTGRRRLSIRQDGATKYPPYEEAVRAMASLLEDARSGIVPSSRIQTGLYEVLRIFLQRRFGLPVMSASTTDLLVQLKGMVRDPQDLSNVSELLRIADAVKYARYASSGEETIDCIRRMKGFITMLNEINN